MGHVCVAKAISIAMEKQRMAVNRRRHVRVSRAKSASVGAVAKRRATKVYVETASKRAMRQERFGDRARVVCIRA